MKKLRLKMIGIVFASVVAAFMVMTICLLYTSPSPRD